MSKKKKESTPATTVPANNMDWMSAGLMIPAEEGYRAINYGNGYVDCMERSWDGKFSLKVIASAIDTLAEAKEAYAYRLGEISKGHILPESEKGSTLELAWNAMKKSLLEECKEVLTSTKELKGLSNNLIQLKHTQTIIKRKIAEQAAAVEKELGDAMDEALKSKNKFDAAKLAAEKLVTKLSAGDLKPEVKAKLAAKMEKTVAKTKMLDQQHFTKIKRLNEVQFRHKESMDEILENLQTVEEARLKRSKSYLQKMTKMHRNDLVSMGNRSVSLQKNCEIIDVVADIKGFINDTDEYYKGMADGSNTNNNNQQVRSSVVQRNKRSLGFFGGLRRKYHTHKNANVIQKSRRPNGPFRMARYQTPASLLLDSAKVDWRSSKAKETDKVNGDANVTVISNAKLAKPPPRGNQKNAAPKHPKPPPRNPNAVANNNDEEKKEDVAIAQAVVGGNAPKKPPPVKPRGVKPSGSNSAAAKPPPKKRVAPPKRPSKRQVVMDNGEVAPPETPMGMPPMKPPARQHSPSYHSKRPPIIKARGTMMKPAELETKAEEGKNLLNSAMSV